MNQVLKRVSQIALVIFSIVSFGLMVTLTYSAISRIFPGDVVKAVWGVSMLDVAALVWLFSFAFASEGLNQRAGSFINFIIALCCTLGMVALEVLISGSALLGSDLMLGQYVVYLFIFATVCNIVGVYFHELQNPKVMDEIEAGISMDKVLEEAKAQAEEEVKKQLKDLGGVIAARYVSDLKVRLSLPLVQDTQALIVDALAVSQVPTEAKDKPRTGGPSGQNDLTQAIPVEIEEVGKLAPDAKFQ